MPEAAEREAAVRELVRRGDWDAADARAREFSEFLANRAPSALVDRIRALYERVERLARAGRPLPAELSSRIEDSRRLGSGGPWVEALRALLDVLEAVQQIETEFAASLVERTRALGRWAGVSEARVETVVQSAAATAEAIRSGRPDEGIQNLSDTLRRELPEAEGRRSPARSAAEGLLAVARDLGVPAGPLERSLEMDGSAPPLDWPESVGRVGSESGAIAETLRGRALAVVESLLETVERLSDFGIDPSEARETVRAARDSLPSAPPSDLPAVLQRARAATEAPVVEVVAGLLDDARPRLVEARRLGRDPSEVFAAMSRAREALRLKIYSEALAASQEASERAEGLTADLDTARSEAESIKTLLARLRSARFVTSQHDDALGRVSQALARADMARARRLLEDTVGRLGRDALQHFQDRLRTLEHDAEIARGWGFLPEDFDARASEVRGRLAEGDLADGAEGVARLEAELRAAAGPYVARRVDEIEKGAQELPDQSRVAAVRRHLADADVGLRVKGDLGSALESLRRAEREFAALFAAFASTLVEALEEERRVLEAMGGAGDEIQRQIDEVQQIFNMGDFVKAFRVSQEIRTRAEQQQLVRAEEAVSHAKLALVEIGKMGVDTSRLKGSLEAAQEALRAGDCPSAFRRAAETQEAARSLRGEAQSVLDMIAETTVHWQTLRAAGVVVEGGPERVAEARTAYRGLEFDRARSILTEAEARWLIARDRAEAEQALRDIAALLEDGRRLSLPLEAVAEGARLAGEALGADRVREASERARAARDDALATLRPVLEEYVRHLERDLEVARAAGLNVSGPAERVAEARRRSADPVPAGVAALAEAARTELAQTQGFLEQAERSVRRAVEAVDQAEFLRIDASERRSVLEVARERLAKGEYARAMELATEVEREANRAVRDQVTKSLAGFQGGLVRARREGADTALAENLLEQARRRLEEGQPVEALQLAARSEAELERVELQLRLAEGALAQVESRVSAAAVNGLAAPEAASAIRGSRDAFEAHNFSLALDRAFVAHDALSLAAEGQRRAREAIDAAERQVTEAGQLGAEVSDALSRLESARAAAQTGAYGDAAQAAREAGERATWAAERVYAAPLEEIRSLSALARDEGTESEVADIASELRVAERAAETRDWTRAVEAVGRTRDRVRAALDAAFTRRRGLVDALRAETGEADDNERALRDAADRTATEARAKDDFAGAFGALRAEESRARDLRRARLARELEGFQGDLLAGEKLGLDTMPAMELFGEAKLALESGSVDPTAGLLERGRERLDELVRPRLDDYLREVESELVFAHEGLNVSLAMLPERLAALRATWDARRPSGPTELARQALDIADELQRRKAWHRELLNLHYLVDAALARATGRRIDTSQARRLLEASFRARATDYPLALDKAREALALLREAVGAEVDAPVGPAGDAIGPASVPAGRS